MDIPPALEGSQLPSPHFDALCVHHRPRIRAGWVGEEGAAVGEAEPLLSGGSSAEISGRQGRRRRGGGGKGHAGHATPSGQDGAVEASVTSVLVGEKTKRQFLLEAAENKAAKARTSVNKRRYQT